MSFHGGWNVGLIVRVVLCSWRAFERLLDEVNVDGWGVGVLSIVAIILLASDDAAEYHEKTNEGFTRNSTHDQL